MECNIMKLYNFTEWIARPIIQLNKEKRIEINIKRTCFMYMKKYPCVYMRGGTSKAVFFHEKDLPEDQSLWDDIFMKVMGTPDVKQIDGMGGTVSSTSKVAIISKSDRPDVDVNIHSAR